MLSGNLWNLLIREQPIDRLNSINDLYRKPNWKNSRIYVPVYFDFNEFLKLADSEMSKNFKNRSKLFNPVEVFLVPNSSDKFEDLLTTVFENNSVLTLDNLNLHYFKVNFKNPFLASLKEDIDYHISESGLSIKPYFLTINPRSDKELVRNLNLM